MTIPPFSYSRALGEIVLYPLALLSKPLPFLPPSIHQASPPPFRSQSLSLANSLPRANNLQIIATYSATERHLISPFFRQAKKNVGAPYRVHMITYHYLTKKRELYAWGPSAVTTKGTRKGKPRADEERRSNDGKAKRQRNRTRPWRTDE